VSENTNESITVSSLCISSLAIGPKKVLFCTDGRCNVMVNSCVLCGIRFCLQNLARQIYTRAQFWVMCIHWIHKFTPGKILWCHLTC